MGCLYRSVALVILAPHPRQTVYCWWSIFSYPFVNSIHISSDSWCIAKHSFKNPCDEHYMRVRQCEVRTMYYVVFELLLVVCSDSTVKSSPPLYCRHGLTRSEESIFPIVFTVVWDFLSQVFVRWYFIGRSIPQVFVFGSHTLGTML